MNFSFIIKKNVRQYWLLLLLAPLLLLNTACKSEFDNYYFEQKEKGLTLSINSLMHGDSDFSQFAALIDKSNVGKLLESGPVYTLFAPTNDAIDAFNNANPGKTTNDMDSATLTDFVNYHIVFGMYYEYDFNKRFKKGLGNSYPTRMYDEETFQYKDVSVFPPSFFGVGYQKNYSSDYQRLYQTSYNPADSTFNVDGSSVIKQKMNMGCTNGVVHGINKVIVPKPNILETLKSDSRFSLYYDFLMRFDTLIYDAEHSRVVNGIEQKAYKTAFWYSDKGVRIDLGFDFLNEKVDFTLFPATNDVLTDFFGPYLSNYGGSFNNIPDDIVVDLLKYNLAKTSQYANRLYLKDMEAGIRMTDSKIVLQPENYLSENPIATSNGLIYPTKTLLKPPRLSSVTGQLLLDPQFASMKYLLEKAGYMNILSNSDYASNEFFLGERIRYSKSWTIIAPSETAFSDSLRSGDLPLSIETLSISVLKDYAKLLIIPDTVFLTDAQDAVWDKGVFVKPFKDGYYKTLGGGFMRKLGNTLYSTLSNGNTANIVATVKGANGVIYIVDNILNPIPANLTVFAQMLNYITTASNVISEITNGQHSSMVNDLRSSAGNITFFIPTDQAIENYNVMVQNNPQLNLKTWSSMSAIEKDLLLTNHIVRKSMLVESQTSVYSKIGNRLDITIKNGEFRIKGQNVQLPEAKFLTINLQGSNGVLHFIDQILLPE